ncbi:MAG: SIP domain-containing protein [Alphaproteobacteria bacterium]
MTFVASARLPLPDHDAVIAPMCEHMLEHGAEIEAHAGDHTIRLGSSMARFRRTGTITCVDLVAETLEDLYFARSAIASHILEFSDGSIGIEWAGDGNGLSRPPNFQRFEVVAVRDLTPRMRRITFLAEAPERFIPLTALHLNLLFQHPDLAVPQWPTVGTNGLISWPDPQRRPSLRKYTVRSIDPESGTLEIDFVIHADAGPGARFAARAARGEKIGVLGPGGGGLAQADWYLFAGDETALPAIARMIEHLPAHARGVALIEVADAGEIQALPDKAGIKIEWLCRKEHRTRSGQLLADAVRRVSFPDDGSSVHVWAGCEFDAFRSIRSHLRDERRLQKHEHLVVAYWRKGRPDDATG